MARPLKFKAGQYIYLTLWGLSTFSALESHPFQICWAYQDEEGQQVLILLAQPRRGFTRKISGSSYQRYPAFVEGPYGKPLHLGQYGTILLLATGVGIAGQLAYIKELLQLYHECEAKTRRIALFWELDAEGGLPNTTFPIYADRTYLAYRYWVRGWMDELLALDVDYVSIMKTLFDIC